VAGGGLAGIATAIKYSSVFALVPALLAAAALGTARDRVRRAAAIVGAFVLAVALTNHFVWWDLPNFFKQLSDQVAITARGHWAASDNPGEVYVMILDRFGPGLPLLVLAGAFAASALARRRLDGWILLSFPLLYLWFMTGRPSQFPRWVYPLVPFVAVAGMTAVVRVVRALRERDRSIGRESVRYALNAAAAALVVVALWQPLFAGAVSLSRRVTAPTHAATIAWMIENIPRGSPVLAEMRWLDLEGSGLDVHRVPDLRAVLDQGVWGFQGYEWVVVPEIHFGHPTLRRLGFVRRFHADQGFGGSLGYDYEVYSVPALPKAAR
jgi:hypothetical protein